jgi:hypothetical protein
MLHHLIYCFDKHLKRQQQQQQTPTQLTPCQSSSGHRHSSHLVKAAADTDTAHTLSKKLRSCSIAEEGVICRLDKACCTSGDFCMTKQQGCYTAEAGTTAEQATAAASAATGLHWRCQNYGCIVILMDELCQYSFVGLFIQIIHGKAPSVTTATAVSHYCCCVVCCYILACHSTVLAVPRLQKFST